MGAGEGRPERPKIEMVTRMAVVPVGILPIVRYAFYLFVFSIPLESLDVGLEGGMFSLSKLTGLMLIAAALLQP
ncbi:MAG: hypothetical protein WA045_09600, partial [Nitrospira sp.]